MHRDRAVRARRAACALIAEDKACDKELVDPRPLITVGADRHGLATELSAALLARLLGIRISVAVAWQRASLRRLDRLRSQLQPPPAQPDRVPVRVSRAGWPASECR